MPYRLPQGFRNHKVFLHKIPSSRKLTSVETKSEQIIFYDIETGGLHFDAPIIELAAIAVEAGTYRELDSIDMKIEFSTKDPHVSMEALGVSQNAKVEKVHYNGESVGRYENGRITFEAKGPSVSVFYVKNSI